MRSRLLVQLSLGILVVVVAAAIAFASFEPSLVERVHREENQRACRDAALISTEMSRPYLSAVGERSAELQTRLARLDRELGIRFRVIAADGLVVADSRVSVRAAENRLEADALRRLDSESVSGASLDGRHIVRVSSAGQVVGYVSAARSPMVSSGGTAHLWKALAVALVLGFLVACWMAWRISRPVARIEDDLRVIADGDLQRRIDEVEAGDFRDFAAGCNSVTGMASGRIEALEREREQFASTLRSMTDGVVALDQDQRVLLLNDAARRMLAIEQADCIGQPFWELSRVQRIALLLDTTLRDGAEVDEEIVIADQDGDRVLELRSSPLRGDGGAVGGAVVVFHDVTELRRVDQIRRDFVANVSHELKTPLTSIRGFVETMLDDPDMDPGFRERFLSKIQGQAERLTSLVSDQLTLARVESRTGAIDRVLVDFREIVDSALALVETRAEGKELDLTVENTDRPIQLRGDPEALQQAVSNLIDNAVKYTPSGGSIRISLREEGEHLVLDVSDSGIGLSTEDQQRVFERFYRVDQARSRELGGTGLGLSIVRNVAVAHGGEASVQSELGRGSTFTIRLPLSTSP